RGVRPQRVAAVAEVARCGDQRGPRRRGERSSPGAELRHSWGMSTYIAQLSELSAADVAVAGGKGANLGEMARAGLPVPGGFVVTTAAFLTALDAAGVRAELYDMFQKTDANSPSALAEASARMRALVQRAGVPAEVRAAVT